MTHISVDRIIGDVAVCEREDMSTFEVPISSLPDGTKEGSVLTINEDGSYFLDLDEQQKRKQRILNLQSMLFED